MRLNLPLWVVRLVCVFAAIGGIFLLVLGRWPAAVGIIVSSYMIEQNLFRCKACRFKLSMNRGLPPNCPRCFAELK